MGDSLKNMYIDLTFRKTAAVLGVCVILVACVYATFVLKNARYGATPAFTAIALAWQEATLRPLYALTGRIWSVERAARGLVGM
ncbi:MAG: hypothetical protein RLZZ416_782, partial [Candidatus Parcubacteria bacterium]